MITLDESIIPMNFNWRSSNTQYNNYNTNTNNYNDKYNDYSVVILNKLIKGIDSLIYGNSHPGFTIDESVILENSILNKCYEILNNNKSYINGETLLSQVQQYNIMYYPIYIDNCNSNNITNTTTYLSFNQEAGKIFFNPASLQNIIYNWLNENTFVCSNANVIQING